MNKNILKSDYFQLLANLKERLGSGRYQAALCVNHELILLYHHIGVEVLKSQKIYGWGAKIIDTLSHDLKLEFPEIKGFSPRNLKYMRKFALEYPDTQFVQQLVAQLPWGHNIFLIELIPIKQERIFYIEKAIAHGWSRNVMVMHIEIALHSKQFQSTCDSSSSGQCNQSKLTELILTDDNTQDFLDINRHSNQTKISTLKRIQST